MKVVINSIIFLFISYQSFCQSNQRRIAIFTSLYLDSVFDQSGNLANEKAINKYAQSGIDFYLGAQMALDSLKKRNIPLDIYFYDLKGKDALTSEKNLQEIKNSDLIIAQSNLSETRIIADASLRYKVPFVSATLPNDAGMSNDPYFVVLNSTLQSHVENIYNFLQKFYSQYKIIVFRKSGSQEDQIKNYFREFIRTSINTPLKINFIDIGNNFSTKILETNLDSTQKTICIAGSLELEFGMKLAQQLASIHKTYPVTLVGMPTWENLNLLKGKLSELEIIYCTPFFYNHGTNLESQLASEYYNKMVSRPSDLFYKGYECTLRFGIMLNDTQKDLASSLTKKGYSVFNQIDIQPVFKDKTSMTLDYFENKHLSFIKVFGGVKNIIY